MDSLVFLRGHPVNREVGLLTERKGVGTFLTGRQNYLAYDIFYKFISYECFVIDIC